MGGVFPEFERELADAADREVVGTAIDHYLEELDNIAENLNVPPLSCFIDHATMMTDFMGLEVEEVSIPEVRWFPAAEGLRTVLALTSYSTEHHAHFRELEALREDLGNLEMLLGAAEKANIRFHLLVDI
jgi:hypothetical protein